MLEIADVTVRFGSTTAVDRVGLTVAPGEILAIVGPSGCGKSTLLRTVAGLQRLDAGRISWGSVDLAGVPAYRRGFGLMFQDGALFPHRTVAGNVAYGLRPDRKPARAERVDELLELVGLAGFGHRPVASLSGGEAQRVALARALAPAPRLLLLDEPLAALDRALRERLLDDLGVILRGTHTTALFVTHDQGEAFALADRIAVMNQGRIRQVGPPRQVWSEPADEWVAGFVGFRTVLSAADWFAVTGVRLGESRVALRPAALVADPSGPVTGRCLRVLPGPERSELLVEIPTWGAVPAISISGRDDTVAGELMRLRVDPAAIAAVPPVNAVAS